MGTGQHADVSAAAAAADVFSAKSASLAAIYNHLAAMLQEEFRTVLESASFTIRKLQNEVTDSVKKIYQLEATCRHFEQQMNLQKQLDDQQRQLLLLEHDRTVSGLLQRLSIAASTSETAVVVADANSDERRLMQTALYEQTGETFQDIDISEGSESPLRVNCS